MGSRGNHSEPLVEKSFGVHLPQGCVCGGLLSISRNTQNLSGPFSPNLPEEFAGELRESTLNLNHGYNKMEKK